MNVSTLLVIFAILFMHWIGDFVLQSRDMATNKSTSNKWLLFHCVAYMLPLMIFGVPYAIVNGVLHFFVDYVTSRMTSERWKENKIHDFFVIVGFDQFIHTVTLILTYVLIIG